MRKNDLREIQSSKEIGSKYSCLLFKLNEHLKIDGERPWMDLKVRTIKIVCMPIRSSTVQYNGLRENHKIWTTGEMWSRFFSQSYVMFRII